ncbi:MAG TPA: helix-turn-helix transcriptional regulator [Candidatus Acidoferrales bacterium]|nr:helix-turn-helix transcriptional regulator [Candidatus Acidoferrales bacterium]
MILSSPSLASATGHPDTLSKVEVQVLLLYAAGFTRAEIAHETGLSAHTIGHHLTTAKDKLQARSLAHAVYLFTRSH